MRDLVNRLNDDGTSMWLNPQIDYLLSDRFPRGCGDTRCSPDAKPGTKPVDEGEGPVEVACFFSKYNQDCPELDGSSNVGHGHALDPNLALPIMISTLDELSAGELFSAFS